MPKMLTFRFMLFRSKNVGKSQIKTCDVLVSFPVELDDRQRETERERERVREEKKHFGMEKVASNHSVKNFKLDKLFLFSAFGVRS